MTSSTDKRVRNPHTIPQSARNHTNSSLLQELEKYKFLKSRGILECFDLDHTARTSDSRFQQNPSFVKSLRAAESERTTPIPNSDISPKTKSKDIRESLAHPKRAMNQSSIRTPQKVPHLGPSGFTENLSDYLPRTMTSPKSPENVKIAPLVRGSSDRDFYSAKTKSSSSTSSTSNPIEIIDSDAYNHLKLKIPTNILQNRSDGKIQSLTSRLSSPQEKNSRKNFGSPKRSDLSPNSRKSSIPSNRPEFPQREKGISVSQQLSPKNIKQNNYMQKASSPRQSNANIRERFSQTEKPSFQMSSNNFSKNSFISTDRNSYINPSQINNEKSGLLGTSNYSFTQVTSQVQQQPKKVVQNEKSPRQSISNNKNMVKGFSLFEKSPRQSAPNIMDTATSPTEKRVRHPTPIGSHKNSVSSITAEKSPRQSTPDYGTKRNLVTIEKVLTIEKISSPKASTTTKKSRPETPKERAIENNSDMTKSYEALNKRFNDSKVAKNQTGLTISTLMDEFTELRKNFNKQSEEAKSKPETAKAENQLKVSQTKISPMDDLKKENENIKKTLEFLQHENEALRKTVADVNKYQKEVNYYKSLAESRLKDSSTLAEEIIFLRTTLDKSHFNYLKVQKSQTTPNKVGGIESSPLDVRRSSFRSEKSKDSSSKKVRWRDELESNN